MTNVGGDPAQMTGGAKVLHGAGTALQQLETPINQYAGQLASHAGNDTLAAAARRFGAAFGAIVAETGTQTVAAGQLAAQAAEDLVNATGGAT